MKNIVNFLSPHVAPVPTVTVPPETRCAFKGVPLQGSGVLLKSVVKPATANIADTFRYPSDFISPEVAACFKAQRELRGNLYITEEAIARPLFSVKSAAETGRPSWLSVLTTLTDTATACDETLYCFILTNEAKRRLWPAAVPTRIGKTFDIYYNVGSVSRVLRLKTRVFGKLLKIATFLLTQGFHQAALQKTLMMSAEAYPGPSNSLDMSLVYAVDKLLFRVRQLREFQVACYVARDLRELPDSDSHQNFLLPSLADIHDWLETQLLERVWCVELSDGTIFQFPDVERSKGDVPHIYRIR